MILLSEPLKEKIKLIISRADAVNSNGQEHKVRYKDMTVAWVSEVETASVTVETTKGRLVISSQRKDREFFNQITDMIGVSRQRIKNDESVAVLQELEAIT